jgi:hypothetical protein
MPPGGGQGGAAGSPQPWQLHALLLPPLLLPLLLPWLPHAAGRPAAAHTNTCDGHM